MATKPSHILGMNARYGYTGMNSAVAKKFGFSKLRTKALLAENQIPTAQIYHVFENMDQLDAIQWENIPSPFVIKPASGSAGKGVWVIAQHLPEKNIWIDSDGDKVTKEDLRLHVQNILDGEFSTWGSEHKAFIEEMIVPHPKLAKLAYKGTPDIRVIVFNSVPVMAMMRVPTRESHGRANLEKGAVGLGIDIATGVTTYGLHGKSEQIFHFPHSKKKVGGIQIPFWRKTLETAVRAANIAGYQFLGADLFINEEKGPMIVELNGFPGLSIQLANRAGLKRRLERVEGLEVRDPEHGVKIGQALFAENFSDKIKAEEGLMIISNKPTIGVYDEKRALHPIESLVNTGRIRSVISEQLAEKLRLVDLEDLLWRQQEGIEGKLPVVEVTFKLRERKVTTGMLVSKRLDKTSYKIELGRRDLQGFLIGEVEV
jgi:alpha-L-glutamate ligase-like protein